MSTFKNYIVNYDLNVRVPQTTGLTSMQQMVKDLEGVARRAHKPLKDITSFIGRMHKSINGIRDNARFDFVPTINTKNFEAQLNSLVALASEKGAEAARAFNAAMTSGRMSAKGGKSPLAGKTSDLKSLKEQIAREEEARNQRYFRMARHRDGTTSLVRRKLTNDEKQQLNATNAAITRLKQKAEELERLEKKTGKKLAAVNTSSTPTATVSPVGGTKGFDQKWIAKQLKNGDKTVTLKINAIDRTPKVLASIVAGLQSLQEKAKINIVPVVNPEAFAQAENRMGTLLQRANEIRNALSAPLMKNQPKGGMLGLTQQELQKYLENDRKIAQIRNDLKGGNIVGSAAGRAAGVIRNLERQNETFRTKVSTAMVPTAPLGAVENLINESEKAVSTITPSAKGKKNIGKPAGTTKIQQRIAGLANTVNSELKPVLTIDANILPALRKLAELINAINRNKNHVINIGAVGGTPPVTGVSVANSGTNTTADDKKSKSGVIPVKSDLEKRAIKLASDIRNNKWVAQQHALSEKAYAQNWYQAEADRLAPLMNMTNPNRHGPASAATRQQQAYWEAQQRAKKVADYTNWWEKQLAEQDKEKLEQQKKQEQQQRKQNEQLNKQRAAAERQRASVQAFREKEAIKTAAIAERERIKAAAIAERERIKAETRGATQPSRTVTSIYGGSGKSNAPRTYHQQRKASLNSFGYQLMGNTSLGARTPMFLDMMKGMGMMTGVGAAMSTLTNAFTNAAEYQNTMITARSILEAGYQGIDFDNDFKNMERIVRDVAKKTKFTAPQAADAARFMAMAGLKIPMINASVRPIADVAVIGDNDLGEVADKITNIQTAFGLKPNQMRALADALTKTFTSTNTDMMMLAESMEYAAPMAHLAGAKVEDALAMIGIMGNSGIQGSMAGTTLRMMYQNVINPNQKQADMWESLGIKLKDESGKPRQLMEILNDLRKKATFTKDDKDSEGNWKDEGTPVAALVSKLFRVTASAGAGTLLENLDKVYALAEANRNATGLSQYISEVKQNDIKGMWAKMTSAFTDAVVTEFESQESPIKGYIDNLIKYFNTSDFQNLLHDIFKLVTDMMDMLGTFANIWRGIYNTFGPIIKYTMMAQFLLAQIGYLLAPLRSVYLTIARGAGALGAVAGGGVAMRAAGVSSGLGGSGLMAASGAASLLPLGGKGGVPGYNTSAIQNARKIAANKGKDYANSVRKYHLADAAYLATNPQNKWKWEQKRNRLNYAIEQQYLSNPDERYRIKQLSHARNRANSHVDAIIAAEAARTAALQNMEKAKEQRRLANAAINKEIAKVRHSNRIVSTAALNRAVRMGKIGNLAAFGMAISGGFRSGFKMIPIRNIMTPILNVLRYVASGLTKLVGFLSNPLTIATAAWVAAGIMTDKVAKKMEKRKEEFKAQDNVNQAKRNLLSGDTQTVLKERNRLGYGILKLGNLSTDFNASPFAFGKKYVNLPKLRAIKGNEMLFKDTELSNEEYIDSAKQRIAAMSKYMENTPTEEDYNNLILSPMVGAVNPYNSVPHLTARPKPTTMLKDRAAIAVAVESILSSKSAEKILSPIQKKLENWALIKDKAKSQEEWNKIRLEIRTLAQQYNPRGKDLKRLEGNYGYKEIGEMTVPALMDTYEGQYAIYKALLEMDNENNPLFGYFHAINKLNNSAKATSAEILDAAIRVSGGVQYSLRDVNGKMQTVYQEFENGTLSWSDFEANIATFGLDVQSKFAAYYDMIAKAYEKIREIAKDAGTPPSIDKYIKGIGLPDITKGDLKYAGERERGFYKSSINQRYRDDPNFKKEIDETYGGKDEFLDAAFGEKPWWNFSRTKDDLVPNIINGTIQWVIKQGLKNQYGTDTSVNKKGNGTKAGGKPTAFNYQPQENGYGFTPLWSEWGGLASSGAHFPTQSDYKFSNNNLALGNAKSPIYINIEKIEPHATIKEEIDDKRYADLVTQGLTEQIAQLIS